MHDRNYIESLAKTWSESIDKQAVIQEHNIKPLRGLDGIRLSVTAKLRKDHEFVPVLSESGMLEFAYGWPQVNVITTKQVLNETRQFRLIATTEEGEEHYSDWFDEEEEVVDLQGEVSKDGNVYIDSVVQKRVKELDKEDRAENLPPIDLKLKPKPPEKVEPEPEPEPEPEVEFEPEEEEEEEEPKEKDQTPDE